MKTSASWTMTLYPLQMSHALQTCKDKNVTILILSKSLCKKLRFNSNNNHFTTKQSSRSGANISANDCINRFDLEHTSCFGK